MIIRWLIASVVLLGMVLLLFWQAPAAQKKLQKGDAAVAVSLPNLAGVVHSLPKGEVTLLHFWATWCAPCRAEVPALVDLYQAMKGEGLKILAVSTDQNGDDLRDFIERYHMTFPVVRDVDMAVSNRYGITGYPETYIIDRQGIIQAHIIGPAAWESPELRQQLRQLLQQPAVTAVPVQHSTADVKQPGG